MNLNDKNLELSRIVKELVGKISKLYNKDYSIYLESNYFKDSYDVNNEPAEIYIVSSFSKQDSIIIDMELSSLSSYFLINIMNDDEFDVNYSDSTTLLYRHMVC